MNPSFSQPARNWWRSSSNWIALKSECVLGPAGRRKAKTDPSAPGRKNCRGLNHILVILLVQARQVNTMKERTAKAKELLRHSSVPVWEMYECAKCHKLATGSCTIASTT